MTVSLQQLDAWLKAPESEHLEFKEAKTQFDSDKLTKYCVALANEGGGHMVLGVTNKMPRRVVGTCAFQDIQQLKRDQSRRIRLHIDAAELRHPDGRVVVISISPRPIGLPIEHKGAYWMRRGEDLVPMPPEVLKQVFDEGEPDFSARVCADADLSDLEPAAIAEFRRRWTARAGRADIASLSDERLLRDSELLQDAGLTYAALVLFGSHRALGRHLAQAELIFEYRSHEASISHQQRSEYRLGYFLFHDELWDTINLRNDVYSYRDGLFRREVRTFNEDAVREAVLNAVSHRDYRRPGSIFVRQYPERLEIVSPGGFPPEISPETILFKQSPRNRRIAEAFARCGLVERSGQGADRIFASAIREGKLPPDFMHTDAYQVSIALNGRVQDEAFLLYLERLAQERQVTLHIDDLLVLDAVHRDVPVPDPATHRLSALVELGALERVGRGRGTRYLLSESLYKATGQPGAYTRRKGLDRDTNKALLLKHIVANRVEGSQMGDLLQVLPALSKGQIRHLLDELKEVGEIYVTGKTRGARWFPSAGSSDST